MDKRTILFILLVGATFFGLNLYFSHDRNQKNREILKQQEAKKAKEQTVLTAEAEKRTAKLSDLPISPIRVDETNGVPVAYGLKVDGNILTLAWDSPLPEKIYASGKEQWLLSKDPIIDGPALYGPKPFQDLDIVSVPTSGTWDLQVVTFPREGEPHVYWAEYKDGEFRLPTGHLPQNGIALFKTSTGYLPMGFYAAKGDAFILLQELPIMANLVKHTPSAMEKPVTTIAGQKFYVLENETQQLVFSNVGGALVEINLPLRSKDNEKSVVNEIGFDRQIAEDFPANAHFPAHPYFTANSKEENPPGPIGGYYPLIRRGIWNKKDVAISPQHYALNIVSDYPEMAELVYDVKAFSPESITFEARQPHRRITKTYSIATGAPYTFDVDVQIEGDSRGLWLTSGVPEVEIMSNRSSPLIQYRTTRKGKSDVEKLSLPKVKEVVTVSSVHPDWVVNSNGYLGVILDPLSEISAGYRATAIPGTQVPTRLSVLDPQYKPYPASKYPGYEVLLPIPSSGGSLKFRAYSGPFEESTLKTVDKIYSDPETGYNPDYITSRTFYGWFSFISEPFSKVLFVVMKFFHSITHSWGFSIILLTVFLRLLLYPLNAWSIKSMRRMQQLSPQIQAIQARHKKDPKKGQIEVMQLYRENKVNPFTGCIPILIQIPFLIAMFDLLKSSFQLRGASFIPGWIDNLTAPDVLFQWHTPIFFIGNQFHLLPVLLGGVMFIQQRLSSTAPKDPNKMTDQQRQQKAMGTIMTLVFMVMFYHFPSGLNLYWLSSMLLGILQQWVTNRILDKKYPRVEVLEPAKKTVATKKR